MKTVIINNLEFGTGMPKICVPLTGISTTNLIEEAANASASTADLVEWRIDWYRSVDNIEKVRRASRFLRDILGTMPLLITFRTANEGGQRAISKEQYESLLTTICEEKLADMIDVEVMQGDDVVKSILQKAKENDIITIGSNHDFDKTPSKEEIIGRLCKMQDLGFDITKIAVMPESERDVLTLLDATLAMKETYADRPFITMSMKKLGLISRLAGECFGSCLTFGTVGAASAPGQIGAEELKRVLELMHDDKE